MAKTKLIIVQKYNKRKKLIGMDISITNLWGPRICGPGPLHNRAQDPNQGE